MDLRKSQKGQDVRTAVKIVNEKLSKNSELNISMQKERQAEIFQEYYRIKLIKQKIGKYLSFSTHSIF